MDRGVPSEAVHGYRDAARPPPEHFPLRMGAPARLGLLAGLATIAITVAAWILTGRLFLLFFVAFGPGLFHWLAGAPRAIEVHHDAVVIRSWLRAARRLPASELAIQLTDDDLVLLGEGETIAISTALFPDGSLARCVAAIRAIVVERPGPARRS